MMQKQRHSLWPWRARHPAAKATATATATNLLASATANAMPFLSPQLLCVLVLALCSTAQGQNTTTTTSTPNRNGSSDKGWLQTPAGVAGLVAIIVAAILLVILFIIFRQRKRRRQRTSAASDEVLMTRVDVAPRGSIMMHDWVPAQQYGYRCPPNTESQLLRDLQSPVYRTLPAKSIQVLECIGSGSFGNVHRALYESYEGQIPPEEVAVRKAPADAMPVAKVKLLQTAVIFGQFRHNNVVRLLGIVREGVPFPLVVTEYLAHGPLSRFLRRTRPDLQTQLHMAQDIADGMNYLSLCSFVFGNLEAKHVLVSLEGRCKIAGLGLTSRDMSDPANRAQRFEIRWAAPELYPTLASSDGAFSGPLMSDDKLYTSESDVWAFGVVLYEIWTFGSLPYGNGVENRSVMSKVLDGFRLPAPAQCPREIYRAMIMCWHPEPHNRPSFAQLKTMIDGVIDLLPNVPHLATPNGFPTIQRTYTQPVHLPPLDREAFLKPAEELERPVSPLIPQSLLGKGSQESKFGFDPETPTRPRRVMDFGRPVTISAGPRERRSSDPSTQDLRRMMHRTVGATRPLVRQSRSDAAEPVRQPQEYLTPAFTNVFDPFRPDLDDEALETFRRRPRVQEENIYMTISTVPRRRPNASTTLERRPNSQVVTESDYMTVAAAIASVERERERQRQLQAAQKEEVQRDSGRRSVDRDSNDGDEADEEQDESEQPEEVRSATTTDSKSSEGDADEVGDKDDEEEAEVEDEARPTAMGLAMLGIGHSTSPSETRDDESLASPEPEALPPLTPFRLAAATARVTSPNSNAARASAASLFRQPVPRPRTLPHSASLPPDWQRSEPLAFTAAAKRRQSVPWDDPDLRHMSEAERAPPGTELPMMERRLHSSRTASRVSSRVSSLSSLSQQPPLHSKPQSPQHQRVPSSHSLRARDHFGSSRSSSRENESPSLQPRSVAALRMQFTRQSRVADADDDVSETDRLSPTPGSFPQ